MRKMSDKMRQDDAKMRKMRDLSSVFRPSKGYECLRNANKLLGRGAGEVPPLGWVNPSPRPLQNPDSRSLGLKVAIPLGRSSKIGGSPSPRFRHFALRLAKTPQDAPKTPPRRPKTPPDVPKTPPKAPKTPPRRPQDGPKTPPRRPKTPPRRPNPPPREAPGGG